MKFYCFIIGKERQDVHFLKHYNHIFLQDSFREMLQVLSYGQFPVTHLDFSKMGCQDSPVFGQLHQLKPIASSLS